MDDRIIIVMRFYKRFDADLLALQSMGVPLNTLAYAALELYARGLPFRVSLSEAGDYDIDKRRAYHIGFTVGSGEAERVIRSVRLGYRNQFCKTLIRNALAAEPLWQYMDRAEGVRHDAARMKKAEEEDRTVSVVLVPGKRAKNNRLIMKYLAGAAPDAVTDAAAWSKQAKAPAKQKDPRRSGTPEREAGEGRPRYEGQNREKPGDKTGTREHPSGTEARKDAPRREEPRREGPPGKPGNRANPSDTRRPAPEKKPGNTGTDERDSFMAMFDALY